MKTYAPLGAVLALLLCPAAHAAEFRAAYGDWAFDISGTATENGREYDFKKDLAAQRSAKHSLAAAWDTGPGWWKPDLAFGDSRMGAKGTHTESQTPGFPLPPTTVTLTVYSDFRDTDLVARYPLNTGAFKLAAGVAVKRLRGVVEITDTSQSQPSSRGEYDEIFPELHLQARWSVENWLAFEATGQGVQSGAKRAYELRGGIELRPLEPLLLEASWQQKRYDIQTSAEALNANLTGFMLRAGILLR